MVETQVINPKTGRPFMAEDMYVSLLSTSGTPVNSIGNSKVMKVPTTRMDRIWELENPGTDKPVIYIADTFVIPTSKYRSQVDLFRYKEMLERKNPEMGAEQFDKLMWQLMNRMEFQKDKPHIDAKGNKIRNPEKLDTYYFGGAGDKERAHFIKHHPRTEKKPGKDLNKQFDEIMSIMGGGKTSKTLYEALETAFVDKYKTSLDHRTIQRLKNYHK